MVAAQVLFSGGKFQWKRLQNLIRLAKEGSGGLDLSDTVATGARVVLLDERLRSQLLLALTEDNRLHIDVRTPFPWPHLSLGALAWSSAVKLRQSACTVSTSCTRCGLSSAQGFLVAPSLPSLAVA